MARDHHVLVQHSQFHTQEWPANGDISIIISKSGLVDIIATEKCITGYACKGNEQTGTVCDLFNEMVNSTDENYWQNTKSLCTKMLTEMCLLLKQATKYPLYHFYRCKMLERSGFTVTKLVPIDKYINRSEKRPFFFILVHFKKRDEKVPVISGETLKKHVGQFQKNIVRVCSFSIGQTSGN